MDTLLYTKHGKPWGYIRDDFVYKYPSEFFGWIENGEVFSKGGQYIGHLLNQMYIVRNKNERPHTATSVKNNSRPPQVPFKDTRDLIPGNQFSRTDEIDCLENL